MGNGLKAHGMVNEGRGLVEHCMATADRSWIWCVETETGETFLVRLRLIGCRMQLRQST